MKFTSISTIALVAGLSASAALAQDWGGFYAGVSLNSADANTDVAGFPANLSSSDSAALGVYAGYNYQLASNLVLGGELSYVDMATSYNLISPFTNEGLTQIRGRVGYGMEMVMPYLALGYATTDINIIGGGSNSASAMSIGVGAEIKVGENTLMRAEYTSADFGDIGSSFGADRDDFQMDVESMSVGIGWKF
ncbi:MAG: outer membrane beta-barrel protein [Rhodobacterales bacterium]|nr:outer membrane beta-barrel protein [Rhodobacterales bacterium]